VRGASYRNRQEVQSHGRSNRSQIHPQRYALAPEQRQNQRYQHHTRSGNESRIRCSRVAQPGSLKGVTAKHEEAQPYASENLFALQRAEYPRTEYRHTDAGQSETQREKNEHRRIVQRILDHHKRCSPQQRAKRQRQFGAQTAWL
jgi:hypothetical protein